MTTRAEESTRRTQAERSAETRARILEGVLRCLDEVGFARATHRRIAHCAGVSVGAVQHHFPTKSDVMAAVLRHSFGELASHFTDLPAAEQPLGKRVAYFVERAWRHYGSRSYRSTIEILLGTREDGARRGSGWPPAPVLESARNAARLWGELFADAPLDARGHREVRQYAFSTLTGLAITHHLQPQGATPRPQLVLLERGLVAALGGGR